MPQAIVALARRMRGPRHAKIYSDSQGPGLLIQNLMSFPSLCHHVALTVLTIPVWMGSNLGQDAENCLNFFLRVMLTHTAFTSFQTELTWLGITDLFDEKIHSSVDVTRREKGRERSFCF